MDDTLTSAGPIPAGGWDNLLGPPPRQRRPIVLVLGMHRSGTSLCAHVLSALGIDMSDDIRAQPSNAKGHWERAEIVAFHDRILEHFNRGFYTPHHDFSLPVAWWADPRVGEVRREIVAFLGERIGEAPFGFKDPRAARLLPMWHQIFGELDLDPKIVFCLRNPGQVARSLQSRDGLDDDVGELRWFAYVVDFFRYSKNCDIRILEYETWFEDPEQNLAKLRNFIAPSWLQSDLDTEQLVAAIIDDRLRHDDRDHRRARLPLVRTLYGLARRAERDPGAREQILTIAAQYVSFDQMQAGVHRAFEHNLALAQRVPALEEEIAGLKEAVAQRDAAEARARESAARAEESAARESAALARLDRQRALAERQRLAAQLAAAESVHAEVTRLRAALAEAEAEARQRREELDSAGQELIELSEALAETQRLVEGVRAGTEERIGAHRRIAYMRRRLAERTAEAAPPPHEIGLLREALAAAESEAAEREMLLDRAGHELSELREALASGERAPGEFRANAERELAEAVASIADLAARLAERTTLAELGNQHRSVRVSTLQLDQARLTVAKAAQDEITRLLEALAAAERSVREREAAAETAAAARIDDLTARLDERTREAAEIQVRARSLYAELLGRQAQNPSGTGLIARVRRGALRRRVGAAIRAGDRASRAGEMAAAARFYRRALDNAPDLAPIWVQLGHVLKEQGDYDRAEAAYRHSLGLDASVADTHLQLGHLLKLTGRLTEAADAYVRASELDPGLPHVARELDALWPRVIEEGDKARDARDWASAVRHYRCALQRRPGVSGIWVQLGSALKEQGDYAGAEAAYRQSLRLDGSAADTHVQLGHLLKQLSSWTEAAEAYARALQLNPGLQHVASELEALVPWLVGGGDKARDARDWPAAVRNYRLALDCQPDLMPIWVQLGHALKEQDDHAGAEAAYHRALALDGSVADTHLQLGHLLKLQGRHREAVESYVLAVRLDPDLTPAREALDSIGGYSALEVEGVATGDAGGGRRPDARELLPPLLAARADLLLAEAKLAAASGDDVIWLGVIDWHWRIQRPQHLAANLADLGTRVFYVSLVFEPPDGKGRFRIVESPHRGVFEVRMRFAGNDAENLYRGFSPQAIGELQVGLDELIAVLGLSAPVVVLEHPAWQPVACGVPGATVVYDCLDLATGFSTNGEATASYEAATLATADLVVAASQPLVDHIAAQRSSVLIRNAADVEFFGLGFSDRPAGPRPVIGYFGAIAEWFNIEWIEHCAAARPDWDFRLVGRTDGCDVGRAKSLRNVRFLGERPYRELPQFLREVDVAVIPFRMIELIKCTNPVKLYEYMAAGKAVVAAPMPEVIGATDLAYIAEDAQSFDDRIAQALAEDSSELRLRRMAWAREHTWASRGHQLKEAIEASRPPVSVVILTYDNWAYTSACLASVLDRSDYPNLEIIVVDNASIDQTRDNLRALERQDERVRVVLNDTNLGFAAGNNVGLRLATGEFVILLNNDTVVTHGWVRDLIRPMQLDPTIGMAGPLTNAIGNEQKVTPGYGGIEEMHRWSRRFVRERLRRTFEAGNLAFFCIAMRRAVLDEAGLLDEAYGIGFFEDDDYCRRVRQAGYRLVIADDVFVHHHLSASFAPRGSEANDALMARNKAIFEERWGPWQPHRYRDEPGFG